MKKLLIIACTLFAFNAHAELTGVDRDEAIKGATESCTKSMAKAPQPVSASTIASFCECYADRAADNLDAKKMRAFETHLASGQPPAWFTAVLKESASFCSAKVKAAEDLKQQNKPTLK